MTAMARRGEMPGAPVAGVASSGRSVAEVFFADGELAVFAGLDDHAPLAVIHQFASLPTEPTACGRLDFSRPTGTAKTALLILLASTKPATTTTVEFMLASLASARATTRHANWLLTVTAANSPPAVAASQIRELKMKKACGSLRECCAELAQDGHLLARMEVNHKCILDKCYVKPSSKPDSNGSRCQFPSVCNIKVCEFKWQVGRPFGSRITGDLEAVICHK